MESVGGRVSFVFCLCVLVLFDKVAAKVHPNSIPILVRYGRLNQTGVYIQHNGYLSVVPWKIYVTQCFFSQ